MGRGQSAKISVALKYNSGGGKFKRELNKVCLAQEDRNWVTKTCNAVHLIKTSSVFGAVSTNSSQSWFLSFDNSGTTLTDGPAAVHALP